jgi:hypothetical protein
MTRGVVIQAAGALSVTTVPSMVAVTAPRSRKSNW